MIKLVLNWFLWMTVLYVTFNVTFFWIVPKAIRKYRNFFNKKKAYEQELEDIENERSEQNCRREQSEQTKSDQSDT